MTALGDRMKEHEADTRLVLPTRSLFAVRVDGHAFHNYTRGLARPFDADFASDMDAVGLALVEMIPGALVAYVQSDEASVVFYDYASESTQPWFGGVVAKIVSLTAAKATVTLATRRPAADLSMAAMFDSRVFALPDPVEAAAYLLWRQRDAQRNAVSMAAQTHFPHRALQGVHAGAMRDMLAGVGVNFEDYPLGFRQGRVVVRREVTEPVTWTHGRTQETTTTVATRHKWFVEPAPLFTTEPDGWLLSHVLPAAAASFNEASV